MKKNQLNQQTVIYAVSPLDFQDKLKDQNNRKQNFKTGICLALDDKECHIKNFNFEKMSMEKIRQQIAFEAVDFLGLPLPEIVIDMQICSTDETRCNGYYVCLPKEVMEAYLQIAQSYQLSIDCVTVSAIMRLESSSENFNVDNERKVFLDFSKEKEINIFVFNKASIELIRQCPYENEAQAVQEVLRSLKSVCAQSVSKKFDQINIYGSALNTEHLGQMLSKHFDVVVNRSEKAVSDIELRKESSIFSLNLLRNLQLSKAIRTGIYNGLKIILMVGVVAFIFFDFKIIYNISTIKSIKASFTPNEYQQALALKKRTEK